MSIEQVFTKEIITHYKNNKHLITQDLLDALRVSNEGKKIAFDILDIPKNEEGYYLDSFGKAISYKNIPTLKNLNTKIPLSPIHITEIERCKNDIYYYMKNYVKIKTPKGVDYPDLRYYQLEFLDCIIKDENESIVGLLPRQCCTAGTIIDTGTANTMSTLFEECKLNSNKRILNLPDKFIESYPGNGRKILTPSGYKEILQVHKTIKYPKFKIILENGLFLEAAHNHVVINANGNEVYVEDCINTVLKTEFGLSKVTEVIDLGVEEHMYDISIDSEDELYYSNGILSHNSGKSITVSIYLSHLILFEKDVNIGIAAQKHSMAKEFLTKTKDIFIELPIWLTPGVKSWNMTSISFENGIRVLSDTANSNSYRGHTVTYSVTDEAAYIIGNDNGTTKFEAYLDSVLPSQSSLAKKKNIFISTANGLNHFYELYTNAVDEGLQEVQELVTSDKIIYSDTVENHYNSDDILKPKEILSIEKINNMYNIKYLKRKIGSNGSIAYNTDWRKVPRWNTDGSPKPPEQFRGEVIAAKGEVFFNQAYANNFTGSSYTLISAHILKTLKAMEPIDIVDGKLRIYHKYIKGNQYICTVDPAKDGVDGFVVNFIDITGLKFVQVATANLDIDYLLMPGYLDDWCRIYGNPYLIIENNEGAGTSVSDQMVLTYDYDNIHYDVSENIKNNVKARKKYSGTRTNKKTRNQILKTLKTFLENGNLIINDADTIKQLFTFILINGKYQADSGAKDDCVMGLALVFTLFNNVKNFTDMAKVAESIKSELVDRDPVNITELITIGSFDCTPEIIQHNEGITYEGFDEPVMHDESMYDAFGSFELPEHFTSG